LYFIDCELNSSYGTIKVFIYAPDLLLE